MPRRIMPPAGFYLNNQDPTNCIYSSGTTKGNKYYHHPPHGNQWNELTWTCVPGLKDLAANYTFSQTVPPHLPPKKP